MRRLTMPCSSSVRLLLVLLLLLQWGDDHGAEASWIDIDTPLEKRTTTSFVDGATYELVRKHASG